MRLWGFVRSLSLPKFWALFVLCMGNLGKVMPTWKATKKSVAYASKYYGKTHRENTPANAFRHSIWNYLIINEIYQHPEQINALLSWATRITDLHEDLFPNDRLAKFMDLHNNRIGRQIFQQHRNKNEEEMVEFFRELTKSSIKINSDTDLGSIPDNRMIHLVDFSDLDTKLT